MVLAMGSGSRLVPPRRAGNALHARVIQRFL
jgi:hypothetical protein